MLDVKRKEQKYIIDEVRVLKVKKMIGAVLSEDSHNRGEGYPIRSLYFDTVYNKDYIQKIDGLDNRQKIRLRIYDTETDFAKLELKEKFSDKQRKRSIRLTREEAERMAAGDYSILCEKNEELAMKLYLEMTTKAYIPKTIVEYDRLAYIHETNDIRITFDRNIRATEASTSLFDRYLSMYPVAPPSEVTLEVKYNGFLFSFIEDAIKDANAGMISNSKYCRARMISAGVI